MKKLLIATAVTLMCSSAFAQTTGPAGQTDNMTKPGMSDSSTSQSGMKKDSMDKGSVKGHRRYE
jgi:uncharacterized protein YdeI (BOF family)